MTEADGARGFAPPSGWCHRLEWDGEEVDLWLVSIPEVPLLHGEARAILSREEGARVDALETEALRVRFASARSAVRLLLGERLGLPPCAVPIGATRGVKPEIADSELGVSWSTSGTSLILALSESREVGVDIETVREIELEEVAALTCTSVERHRLELLAPDDAMTVFFDLWTAKEAYLKGIGVGLRRPPGSVDATSVLDQSPGRINGWPVFRLQIPGHAAALALSPS